MKSLVPYTKLTTRNIILFLEKSLPGLASIDFANSSRKVTQDLIHFLASPGVDSIFDPISAVTHHGRYHYILCLSKKKKVKIIQNQVTKGYI